MSRRLHQRDHSQREIGLLTYMMTTNQDSGIHAWAIRLAECRSQRSECVTAARTLKYSRASGRPSTTSWSRGCAAVEVMLGSPTIKELILRGDIGGLKEIMEKSKDRGMKTFDMALFDLCEAGEITEEEALRNADSENNVRLRLKLSGDQPVEGEKTTFSLEDEQP